MEKKQNEQIQQLFEQRYTCKSYDPDKKVSEEDFFTIMEAARLSPSSMGLEPWQFVLLKNQDVKKAIQPYTWGAAHALDNASHFVLILARTSEDLESHSEYLTYIQEQIQGYPHEELEARKARLQSFQTEEFQLTSPKALADWGSKQTYIPLANMLTVAAMLGIDSTPIEGFHKEKVHKVLVENQVYDPNHFHISTMIAFGYTNRSHRPKTRRPQEEVWKTFS